ncbi:hypothetical protein AVEN_195624-1 [Araneus ventricosus]|uniref:Uncharacterized protein n=1 Tax=Araneus ventricosus TaxID=182803 RepID=A0A4Y2BBF6_ARAVE|nr:hypothetical protein AVEN_195624-1 [Araneus ventricosus]
MTPSINLFVTILYSTKSPFTGLRVFIIYLPVFYLFANVCYFRLALQPHNATSQKGPTEAEIARLHLGS